MFRGLDLNKVLCVDNNIISFAPHLKNLIPIADFFCSSSDKELLKIMQYALCVAKADNLMEANERVLSLQRISDSRIESFIRFYKVEELSEMPEPDFGIDGFTENGDDKFSDSE